MTSMNDKCASGTGATIDKCMIKVGMPQEDVAKITFDPTKLHHVAAKCGVFAETDIVNLVKSGIPGVEIMNSLADAIVHQNLSGAHAGQHASPRSAAAGRPKHLPAVPGRVLALADSRDLGLSRLRLPQRPAD